MTRLAKRVRAGDLRALARALSAIENGAAGSDALLADTYSPDANTLRIGITGPPGAGKSTLVDQITTHWRRSGRTIAILAVDPSSPFSGGAILGDRVRMQRHHDDPGVFIRSMAARGELGGLAPAVGDALTLVEASGRDMALIETAGVGQSEVDVVQLAPLVAVVLTPAQGDDIQAAKAGIMEIADVFVLNKADQAGADETERQLRAMISLIPPDQPKPPIIRTVGTRGEGIAELAAAMEASGGRRLDSTYWRRRLAQRIGARIRAQLAANSRFGSELAATADAVAAGRVNPYTYERQVLDRLQEQWNP